MLHFFEEDSRTNSQLQADLDFLDVTISMYAVDDHDGKRKAQSVFRAERGDWNAVTGTYRQFKAESGFSTSNACIPPWITRRQRNMSKHIMIYKPARHPTTPPTNRRHDSRDGSFLPDSSGVDEW